MTVEPEQPRTAAGPIDDEKSTDPVHGREPSDTYLGLVIEGRYRIDRTLGAGGMGRVYLGTHLRTGAALAVKVIEPHPARSVELETRCLKEARAMMEVRSSHVAHALDVGTLPDGGLYLVMEYLRGEDLDALLRREGPLPWSRLGPMALQLCHGLGSAHRQGIVHRDIKPSNCFRIKVDDNPDHIKIIDFGIAREMHSATGPTQRGQIIGTPEYLAPELVTGDARAGARSDIYALGATLYKLLTGVSPFRGDNAYQIFGKHVHGERIPPSRVAPHLEISPEVDAILLRTLAADPTQRFADTDELAQAIRATLGNLYMSSPTLGVAPRSRPPQAPAERPAARHGSTTETLAASMVVTRTLTLGSTIALFILATELVRPDEATRAATERVAARAPIAKEVKRAKEPVGAKEPVRAKEPVQPVVQASAERVESVQVHETPPPVVAEDEEAVRTLPVQPSPQPEEKPVEEKPIEAKPVEEKTVEEKPVAPEPEPAPPSKPRPEPNFPYSAARMEIAQQLGYLRKTCMTQGELITMEVKFRVDVLPEGKASVRVFSSDRELRACVRKALSFPFSKSPRGGAFIYKLTQASAELVPVPLDAKTRSEP